MVDERFPSTDLPTTTQPSSTVRPPIRRRDVVTNLRHFAIVSYAVDPERIRPHVHERFEIDSISGDDGRQKALVSMVPLEDQGFHFVGIPWLKFQFGQTDYRTYVIDRETGQRAVWFFGTTLDSWSIAVPKYLWNLPWYAGRICFDCEFDLEQDRYTRYSMKTESVWAPVDVELEDTGHAATKLERFSGLENAWKMLTQRLVGVYHRRDGQLGTYHVWHDRLKCTSGRIRLARIGLFDNLDIVSFSEQMTPHSVLIQPHVEFTIYLPPGRYHSPG